MSIILSKLHDGVNRMMFGKEARNLKNHFFEVIDRDMFGKEVPMANYKGDVLMLVNVASQWGLTQKNYAQMSKLSDQFKSQGLKILAFPCNQFGGQEPGSHQEIVEFTKTIDPDMPEKMDFFEKADVNGAKTREVFSFLKEKLPADDGTTGIRWNFSKFLVDHEGNPYKRFGPTTDPKSMTNDIEDLIKKRNGETPTDSTSQ